MDPDDLAGPGWVVAAGVLPDRGDGGIGSEVFVGRFLEDQDREEPENLSRRCSHDCEGVGLAADPVPQDLGFGLTVVASHELDERGLVIATQTGGLDRTEARPVPVGAHHRTEAVQVDDVLDHRGGAARPVSLREHVPADAVVKVGAAVRVVAAEVGLEHLAGQLVGTKTFVEGLHEGTHGEPVEQPFPAVGSEDVAEQSSGGHPCHGGDVEGAPMLGGGGVVSDAAEERADEVGSIGDRAWERPARGEHVAEQYQRQGMAMGQLCCSVAPDVADADSTEQLGGLRQRQRSQRQHLEQRAPERIESPRWRGSVPSGDDHDRACREQVEQIGSGPLLQAGDLFERVDHDEVPWLRYVAGRLTDRCREPLGGGLKGSEVDDGGTAAPGGGPVGHRPGERGLADPAWSTPTCS